MPPPQPSQGAITFQFLAEIAVGATARVDLCRAVGGAREGQLLAVKRLHPHIAEDPGFATQFLDEVWMTAALKHPNVVEVAGWGTDGQGSYLAVELVQGVSLSRLMKTVFDTGEVFSERMVVYIASRLCRALGTAHALRSAEGELLSLVHRDLTPGNVLIGFNGDVKIADFGLAKAKQRLTKTLTGMLKGQPTYMAPEQARAAEIDSRADLFALGVMLFELFSGRRPWIASSDFEMVQLTAKEPPADLKELRPKIDKELVSVVIKCLEKDPEQRFQSAQEISKRLEGWLEVHGYAEGNEEALARFVRRNAMRQMRWFERAVAGELAPPEPVRPRPPRANTMTAAPVIASGAKNAPKKPKGREPLDSESTEVTEAEVKIAQGLAQVVPVIREVEDPDSETENEEVPTLVKRGGKPVARVASAAPNPPAPRPFPVLPSAIIDEDSENRTTSVRRPKPSPRGPSMGAHSASAMLGAGILDMDSEEVPTIPVKGLVRSPPPRTPPGMVRRMAQSSPSITGAPRGESPLAPTPIVTPAPSVTETMSRAPGTIVAPGNGVPPVPLPSVEPAPPPSSEAPPEEQGYQGRATVQERPTSAGTPVERRYEGGPLSEDVLLQEADRLAIEAVRRNEEAKSAAMRAERKAMLAKMASDAAVIAAEAVRLAATSGMDAARARLDDARALEQAAQRAANDPEPRRDYWAPQSQVPPPYGMMGSSTPPSGFGQSLPMQPAQSAYNTPPSMSAPQMLPSNFPQHHPSMNPPEPDLGGFDANSFRSRLKPAVLGVPGLVVGLAVGAFVIVLLLLWLLFP
jgi:serine/threonine-protein kinase